MSLFDRLTNVFVPLSDVAHRNYRMRIGILQGWVSVAVNGLLFILKFGIGLMIGSISIMADAIHTLSDVISSGVVIWGFRTSQKPADKEHPYGHGRAEYIATLVIAILLVVAGIEFIQSSINRILHPQAINPAWWMIIAVAATIILKEWTARYATFLSAKIASGTLHADAWHHRTDAISSLLVVVAMTAGRFGWEELDGWAGIGVALFIIWTGFEIARDAVDDLIGKPPTGEELESIRQSTLDVEGVLGVHDVAVHSYGQEKFASIHIEIDAKNPTMEVHEIAEKVENRIEKLLGVAPTVHVDPIDPHHDLVGDIRNFLDSEWENDERIRDIHDVRIVDHKTNKVILFGINVQVGMPQSAIVETCNEIEKSLKTPFPGYDVDIKVSPMHRY